jgi:hypothetical protein
MFQTQNKREVTTVTVTSRWEEEKEKNRKRRTTSPPPSMSENATTVEPTLQPALVTPDFANTGEVTNNREATSDIASTAFYTAADKQENTAPTTPKLSLFDPMSRQPATPSSGANPAFNAGQALPSAPCTPFINNTEMCKAFGSPIGVLEPDKEEIEFDYTRRPFDWFDDISKTSLARRKRYKGPQINLLTYLGETSNIISELIRPRASENGFQEVDGNISDTKSWENQLTAKSLFPFNDSEANISLIDTQSWVNLPADNLPAPQSLSPSFNPTGISTKWYGEIR